MGLGAGQVAATRPRGAMPLPLASTETARAHALWDRSERRSQVLMAGGVVMICDEFPEFMGGRKQNPLVLGGSGVTVQVLLPNVDEVWEKAVAAGAKIEMPLADQFWGDRYGVIADPFGHRWALFTHKPKPQEMGQTW